MKVRNNLMYKKQLPSIQGVAFFIVVIWMIIFLMSNALGEENSSVDIKDRGVFVLEPFLVYENAYTEQRFEAVDESTRRILSTETISKAKEVLLSCGGKACSIESLSDSEKARIVQACYRLEGASEYLIKQWKDKSDFSNEFSLIKDEAKCDLILVHFVKAKVGSGGSWDFISSGTIVPGTSTTVFKTALIDCNSYKIIWSGSSIERDMPQKHVITKCLKSLYASFPGYSKNLKK